MLGQVLMIELRDKLLVPRAELSDIWVNAGLDVGLLPAARSINDCFRKATPRTKKESGLRIEPYNGPALPDHLKMAVVLQNVEDSRYEIARDHQHRTVIALHQDGTIVYPDGKPWYTSELEFVNGIERKFNLFKAQTMDNYPVRQAVNSQALRAKGFLLKGGVFMMPSSAEVITNGIVQAVTQLNSYVQDGAKNRTFVVNYLDGEGNREQLKQNLDYYIRQTIELQFREVLRYKETHGHLGSRAQSTAMKGLFELGETIQAYESVLQESLKELHAYVHMQQGALKSVVEEV